MKICNLCNRNTEEIITDTLRDSTKQNVYYCKSCDYAFIPNTKTDKEWEEYYNKEYRKKHKPLLDSKCSPETVFSSYVDKQNDRIITLLPYLTKKSRLLEIGCSAGQFLINVQKEVKEVVGVEYNKSYASYASNVCDCKVYNDIDILLKNNEKFDVICLYQVLEHIPNPIEYLNLLKPLLREGGTLCIEVPNLHEVLLSSMDIPYYNQFYFHQAHLHYFSKRSLNYLMNSCGIQGIVVFSQDYNILNHIHWLLNNSPCKNGIETLGKINLKAKSKYTHILENFFCNVNEDYKNILEVLGLTSNITFLGNFLPK